MKGVQITATRPRLPLGATVLLLAGYYVIGLAATLIVSEGATDEAHWLRYFIVGNALGITSTAFLMGLYARMNANLALVLATSGAFLLQQVTFWLVYRTQLTKAQAAGILLVGVGTVLASLKPAAKRAVEEPSLTSSGMQAEQGTR